MTCAIVTARLRLRALAEADAPRLAALAGDFRVARWLSRVPHPYPEAEARAFIRARAAEERRGAALVRAIDDGALAGVVGLEDLGGMPHLGFWIGVPFQGRGYAGEAAAALLAHAFAEGLARPVHSGWFEGNAASARVQEKLGFRVVGRRLVHSVATGDSRPHIDTVLTRAAREARR
jgi:ribosomal-protein-alanine N-acetyltransferase